MEVLAVGATDEELLTVADAWVDLLVAGDFVAASDFLHHPGHYDECAWTAVEIETYLANYGSWDPYDDGRVYRVTTRRDATGDHLPHRDVIRFTDDRLPRIECDLPLNGEWSDLTAVLQVEAVDGGWALSLYDLRVF